MLKGSWSQGHYVGQHSSAELQLRAIVVSNVKESWSQGHYVERSTHEQNYNYVPYTAVVSKESWSQHRWALCYLWNPWIMPVRGTPCTGTCDHPVGTLWVIEPCAYPVRVSVFSQGSCRAVLCLGVLPHACTLSKCAHVPLYYPQVFVALDFLCRCKRLHAVSPLRDCSRQYFPPGCVSFGWGHVYLKMHTIY